MDDLMFPSPIQFLHLRRFSTEPYSVEYHLEPKGGMSIAYQIHNFLEHKLIGIVIATARCRDDELFNKKIGREVALARLHSFPIEKFDPTKPVLEISGLPVFLATFNYDWLNSRVKLTRGEKLPLTTETDVAQALLDKNSQISQGVCAIVEHRFGRSEVELETVDNLRRGLL